MARKNGAVPKFAEDIVDDPEYLQGLKKRANLGILSPALEIKLLEYRWGKPAEEINVNLVSSYSDKSTEELLAIAAALQDELRQLREESSSIH